MDHVLDLKNQTKHEEVDSSDEADVPAKPPHESPTTVAPEIFRVRVRSSFYNAWHGKEMRKQATRDQSRTSEDRNAEAVGGIKDTPIPAPRRRVNNQNHAFFHRLSFLQPLHLSLKNLQPPT